MKDKKLLLQFIFAWILVVVGVVLIFFGFFAEPIGEIDPTVLTAFGEILTFCGSIMGIDYRYKFKTEELDRKRSDKTPGEE